MRASTLKRRAPMQRPATSQTTREIAWRRSGGLCACGCGRPAEDLHHCLPVSKFPELADEPNNVVAVARLCHSRHETAFRRFDRKITRHAQLLALGHPDRQAYIRRVYPR